MFIQPAKIICKIRGHKYEKMHMVNSVTHEKTGEIWICTRCGAVKEVENE